MRIIVLLGLVVGLGCGKGADAGGDKPANSPKLNHINVMNECSLLPELFAVHVLIPISFTKMVGGLDKHDQELWQLRCRVDTKKCQGAYLRLYDTMDVGLGSFGPVEADLMSLIGNVATIKLDRGVALTVDFNAGIATYTEATDSTEGRGEAKCKTYKAQGANP